MVKKGECAYYLVLFSILFLLPIVLSEPPFINLNLDNGLQIEYTNINPIKMNEVHSFQFHLYNISNGLPIPTLSSVKCLFHLYNSSGYHILEVSNVNTEDTYDWIQIVQGNNFSSSGQYAFIFACNNTVAGGFYRSDFQVTPMGDEISIPNALFYFGIAFILILAIIGIIYAGSITKTFWVKLMYIAISYLLFMILSFIFWQISVIFISNIPFTQLILEFIWRLSLILFLPFIIFMFFYLLKVAADKAEKEEKINMGWTEEEVRKKNKR